MIQHRCWQPRSHDPHTWNDGTEDRHCNGKPFRAVSPDAPSRPETPSTVPDQQDGAGADLPAFTVHPGYVMTPDTVALHFPADTAAALAELFPQHADALHAAALDVEMEAERQQDENAWMCR